MDLWDFLGCSILPSSNFFGVDFSPWVYGFGVFLSFFFFFPLSVRFGGLRSAEPWGCLWFVFFFSFMDIMDILNIEH